MSKGIVRRIDDLGRITLQMEVRRELGIQAKDEIRMYREGEKIIIEPIVKRCFRCGCREVDKLITLPKTEEITEKCLCDDCVSSFSAIKEQL